LLDAEDYFNDLTTITLDVNYRSSGVILGVANAIAADAPEDSPQSFAKWYRSPARASRCSSTALTTRPVRIRRQPRS